MAKIFLAFNLNRNNNEFEADFDTQDIIDRLKESIWLHHDVDLLECNLEIEEWVKKLKDCKPYLIYNVTEWYSGGWREAFAPIIFEQLGFNYTWPKVKELVICQDKYFTKNLLNTVWVRSAKWVLLRNPTEIEKVIGLQYPVFIKINNQWSSLWIDQFSKANNFLEANEKIKSLMEKYNNEILVEEYINGIDLSITYIEWLWFFWPLQYIYPWNKEFYDFDLKIYDFEWIWLIKPQLDKRILDNLFDFSQKVVDVIWINRYCRIEFRLDIDTWKVYFLEVNWQICFLEWWSFIQAIDSMNFDDIISHIINLDI